MKRKRSKVKRFQRGERIILNSGAGATVVKDDGDNVLIKEDGYVGYRYVSRKAVRQSRAVRRRYGR